MQKKLEELQNQIYASILNLQAGDTEIVELLLEPRKTVTTTGHLKSIIHDVARSAMEFLDSFKK